MQLANYSSRRKVVGVSMIGIVALAVVLALLARAQAVEAAGVVTNARRAV